MSTAVSENAGLTVECVGPIVAATALVFATMLGCTPTRTGLAVKWQTTPTYELSAIVNLSGQAAGTIVLGISERAAWGALHRMIDEITLEITDEVRDAVGELAAMIGGQTKLKLKDLALTISIPRITRGRNQHIPFPADVRPICIRYDSEIGPFAVDFTLTRAIQTNVSSEP